MRLVITRVKEASCKVYGEEISKINNGLLILQGFKKEDTDINFSKIIKKITNMRIFEDENGKMNKSIKDTNGEILLISQFTLYANTKEGNRPSFFDAMEYEKANKLYLKFYEELNKEVPTKIGRFGADMDISSINKGPITIIFEEEQIYGQKN